MNFFDFQKRLRDEQQGPKRPRPRPNPRPAAPSGKSEGENAAPDALSVRELTAQIERSLKSAFPTPVLVQGEVSNFKHHGASGHAYFTLKDPDACIDCVMFRSDTARLKFQPDDGMEILVRGRVAVYPQRGRYQLYVTSMEPLGQGALELAFRQLCQKLEAEGLFAPERKKPLPPYPRRIALVTSRETAALQDMLKVLRRYPWVKLLLCHVPVQGDGSAEKIAQMLADLNRSPALGVELILLGRGGGSLEDLWEFNEEIVARAIVASRIPVVTGIGHEVDVAIADLVADHHAHTPTEAAQVAVAQWRLARDGVDNAAIRLRRELRNLLQESRQWLDNMQRHELFRRPLDRINALRQLLDDRQRAMALGLEGRLRTATGRLHEWSAELARLVTSRLRRDELRLTRASVLLRECHPRHALALAGQRLGAAEASLHSAMLRAVQQKRKGLEMTESCLSAVNPDAVLKRGYTITTVKKTGAVVRSARQLKTGERVVTRFADGSIESTVEDSRQLPLFE